MGYKPDMPTDNPKILLTLNQDLLDQIEDFRYGNRIPSRSEAVRRLIEIGLESLPKDKKTTIKQ